MACQKHALSGLLWLLAALVAFGTPAAADERVRKIRVVEMQIRSMASSGEEPKNLVLKADRPSRLRFESVWDEIGEVRVDLHGRAEPQGDSGAMKLRLRAELTLPNGRKVQALREASVSDRSTILFEVHREGDRPFTLAVTAEVSQTWEVVRAPAVGAPVRFEVEVVRVDGNRQISLERNLLDTFVEREVRYEFIGGPDLTDEALTLSLTPVRVIGDLVEVRVHVSGRIPDGDDVTVIARDENLIANRGAVSPVTVTAGEPPVGYQFRITARFE